MNVGTQLTASGALRELRTLSDVVRDFSRRFRYAAGVERSAGHHNPVVDFAAEARDLSGAIERAVAGRRRDGKMFSEYSNVRRSARVRLLRRLLGRKTTIRNSSSFDTLYEVVRAARPSGIGETTIYNVATCVGAYLDLHPEHLYLHAGPLVGWKRLTGERGSPYRVEWSRVPKELRRLSPHRVEDLLCEYRDLLNPGMLRR